MHIMITTDSIFKMKEFYFLMYIFGVNIYGIIITAVDKYKARMEKWRIRERNFFVTALLGGAMGIILGMVIFHHKTQHKTFSIGIPVIYVLNVVCFFLFIYLFYIK